MKHDAEAARSFLRQFRSVVSVVSIASAMEKGTSIMDRQVIKDAKMFLKQFSAAHSMAEAMADWERMESEIAVIREIYDEERKKLSDLKTAQVGTASYVEALQSRIPELKAEVEALEKTKEAVEAFLRETKQRIGIGD